MPNKRSSKTQDINQIAADILEEAVGEPAPITPVGKKNPSAVDLGRLGDLKGGAAKAKGLVLKKRKARESKLDIGRAKSLVEEISENLAALPQDSAKYAQLRAEVEDLKAMLGRTDAHLPLIEDKMKSVHALFDGAAVELRADGIRVGIFLKEIGRMLGLD